MKNSEYITHLADELSKVCGLKYESLMYKKHRDEQRKAYTNGVIQKPMTTQEELDNLEKEEYLTALLQVIHHAEEIKKLTKRATLSTKT